MKISAVSLLIELNNLRVYRDSPGGSVVKNLPANAGDVSLIPRSRRSPGGGKNARILWYSCLENPMDRGV